MFFFNYLTKTHIKKKKIHANWSCKSYTLALDNKTVKIIYWWDKSVSTKLHLWKSFPSKYPSIKTKPVALWTTHSIEVKYIDYQWPSAFSKGYFSTSQLLYCQPERWQEPPYHIEWCCFMIHQEHQNKSCFLAWNSLCPQTCMKKKKTLYFVRAFVYV